MSSSTKALAAGVLISLLVSAPAQAAPSCETQDDSRCETWTARSKDPAQGKPSYDRPLLVKTSPGGDSVFTTGTRSPGDRYTIFTIAHDAQTGAQRWTRTYAEKGAEYSYATDLVVSPDSSKIFVIGGHNPGTTNNRWRVLAYRARDGKLLWRARGTRRRGVTDAATIDGAGSVLFVTGSAHVKNERHERDMVTVAFSTHTGRVLWREAYNGTASQRDAGLDLSWTPDNKLYVLGLTEGDDAIRDFKTMVAAYDVGSAAPTLAWERITHSFPRHYPFGSEMELLNEHENVFVTAAYVLGNGSEGSNTDTYTYRTLALGTPDGSTRWKDEYSLERQTWPGNPYLAVDRDSNALIITGTPPTQPSTSGGDSFLTRGFDGDSGEELWRAEHSNEIQTFAGDVVVDSERSRAYVMATDSEPGLLGGRSYRTIAYNTTDGAREWAAAFSEPGNTESNPYDIALGADGWIFVTGSVNDYDTDDSDFVTIAYEL